MYLLFDFELAGITLPDDTKTGTNLLEFRNHKLSRLTELAEEINQHPDGLIIMNYYSGTYLQGVSYKLKAFSFPDELCTKIQDLLTEDDFGIIYQNIMVKRKG